MGTLDHYGTSPDYAVPPGETLREVMESKGMTQKELAIRTGLTPQTINRIFKGEQPITFDTANKLELVTGVPAHFWNNLETLYREQLTKIIEIKSYSDNMDWLKSIPTKELIERGFLEPQDDDVLLLRETLAFYGVSSVSAWHDIWESPAVAARRSPCFETDPGRASAWIRLGELKSESISCQLYNQETFKQALEKIRSLTREKQEMFEPEIIRLCSESGVAVALVPKMDKVPWNGASKWLSPTKAMIILNIRGKKEDIFWFSFFHEAGHVLYGSKKNLYIADKYDPEEKKANRFASESLIPDKYNSKIQKCRSKKEIIEIANLLNISPGIVAGRYHYLTKKFNYFTHLIQPLEWKN